MSSSALIRYYEVWDAIAEDYYNALYDKGYQFYDDKNYTEAIKNLQLTVDYNIDFKEGYAAYYLAQAYRKSGNADAARQYYQYVIDHYPDTNRAKTAEKYVNAD